MQIAEKNGSKVFFHAVSQLAESKGSGDVRGTLQISAAGICQEQTVRYNGNICLRCCSIVDDSSMLAGTADWLKTLPQIAFLFFAEGVQFFSGA